MGFAFSSCTSEDFVVQPAGGGQGGAQRRLKREDCEFVKHDKLFSNWKILVGPSDWKERAAGKDGVERYHLHNLPADCLGPGVYELGVTAPSWLPTSHCQYAPTVRRQDVVVVYVGQADNIRQRLHKYGRAGAHLEGSRSSGWYNDIPCGSPGCSPRMRNGDWRGREASFADSGGKKASRGPRLFSEVFALGSSIAFRWAETESKVVAEQVEAELLSVFDYAWNKGGNGARRSRDILAKLFMGWPTPNKTLCTPSSGKRWVLFGTKRVGITVAVRKPQDILRGSSRSKVGSFCFLLKKRPQVLAAVGTQRFGFTKLECSGARCGVLTDKGVPCNALPVKGHKRCLLHKGMGVRRAPARKSPLLVKNQSSAHAPLENTRGESVEVGRGAVCLPEGFLGIPFSFKSKKEVKTPPGGEGEGRRPRSLSFNSWVRLESEGKTRVHDSSDPRCSDFSENERVLAELILHQTSQEKVKPSSHVAANANGVSIQNGSACTPAPGNDRNWCPHAQKYVYQR